MQVTSSPKPYQQGFTLIELSIVLVIIGLIVGGIITGRSLIKQASMRATLTLINQLNAGVNTFHDKFNGLPGDLATAASSGLTATSPAGTALGNGLIDSSDAASPTGTLFQGEIGDFFFQMYQAQVIQDFYNQAMAQGTAASTANGTTLPTYMMTSPFGTSTYLWVATGSGDAVTGYRTGTANIVGNSNYVRLGKITAINAGGAIVDGNGITPTDAAAFDAKLDDGIPNSGNVLAVNSGTGNMGDTTGAGKCDTTGTNAANGVYDTNADPTTGECSLAIKAAF